MLIAFKSNKGGWKLKPKKNLQIKIAEDSLVNLKNLKEISGLSSVTDVIKFSISLFKWTLEKQKEGYEIYAVPKDERKEVEKINLLLPT